MTPAVVLSVGTRADLAWLVACPRAARPDIVELRLDLIEDAPRDAEGLVRLMGEAVGRCIVACRPGWEGGHWDGSEADRRRVLEQALAAGATWVDVEVDAEWADEIAASDRSRIVLSHHWPEPRPEDVAPTLERMIEFGPAVAKLVAPADRADDAAWVVGASRRLQQSDIDSACFCLGEQGAASRLVSLALGGCWTYAAAPTGRSTAPGQWDLRTLLDDLRVRDWRAGDAVFGVIGEPVRQSLSPAIFNAAFAHDNQRALYAPLPGNDLGAVLGLAERSGVAGLSVTMPFKREVMSRCAQLTPAAASIGAVNTLRRVGDRWHGDNTDGEAAVAAISAHVAPRGARCAVIGAGGAARAAVAALIEAGAEVTVANRTPGRATELAADLGCRSRPLAELASGRWDVLVNATPVGMGTTTDTPVPTAWLGGSEVVLDMVYRPLRTAFLESAGRKGCRTVTGLEMFLRQAAGQYLRWTGREAPLDVMRETAMQRLEPSIRGGEP